MKGKFITLEGCEGAGKTTQQKMLSDYLERNRIDYVFTREPGGNPVSEKIRSLILDGRNASMTGECEALLYAASRAQVVHDVILPALERGTLVVCDRYIDSSLAYQGVARGLGFDFVEKANAFAVEKCLPDATIFFDIDPVSAFARKNGADENDRMEQAGIAFHQKVYEGYLALAERYPDRFFKIDAKRSAEEIHSDVIALLKDRGIL